MTERIGSPDNDPDSRDEAASPGQGKPEGQDAPASLRPADDKPSRWERATTAVKDVVVPTAAALAIGAMSYAPLHSDHDLTNSRDDRSAHTAKADHRTTAGKNAEIPQGPADQAIRPSAGDRVVAAASAPVPAAENGRSPGDQLEKWIDEDIKELMTSEVEDQEKRKGQS